MGKSILQFDSIFALCKMHLLSPPLVPPASKNISGLFFSISSISSSVISKEYTFIILAPAPKQASLAAVAVTPGTKPLAIIFNPPAAEEQAKY
ncbi:hypothetical protein SDC9_136724 [bioreactor metagenome]|uniref:Uncharacterized protein n=1 Tax=bioreactor metagenome TaxID=1076179 RepID=A0A645DM28_9ZZZZ